MTQRPVLVYDKKAAERLLRDIEKHAIPASAEELEVLRLVAAGDASGLGRDFYGIRRAVEDRHPQKALFDARQDAKDLLKSITCNPDGAVGLTEADMARLRGAGRAHDITRAEITAIRRRWDAGRDRLHLEREAEDERAFAEGLTNSVAEAEFTAEAVGWVLAPNETPLSRMRDLSDAERLRRGAWMIDTEELEAWVREVEAATAEGRAPNRPRPKPYEERRWLPIDYPL